jgi:hypothetical protein
MREYLPSVTSKRGNKANSKVLVMQGIFTLGDQQKRECAARGISIVNP